MNLQRLPTGALYGVSYRKYGCCIYGPSDPVEKQCVQAEATNPCTYGGQEVLYKTGTGQTENKATKFSLPTTTAGQTAFDSVDRVYYIADAEGSRVRAFAFKDGLERPQRSFSNGYRVTSMDFDPKQFSNYTEYDDNGVVLKLAEFGRLILVEFKGRYGNWSANTDPEEHVISSVNKVTFEKTPLYTFSATKYRMADRVNTMDKSGSLYYCITTSITAAGKLVTEIHAIDLVEKTLASTHSLFKGKVSKIAYHERTGYIYGVAVGMEAVDASGFSKTASTLFTYSPQDGTVTRIFDFSNAAIATSKWGATPSGFMINFVGALDPRNDQFVTYMQYSASDSVPYSVDVSRGPYAAARIKYNPPFEHPAHTEYIDYFYPGLVPVVIGANFDKTGS